VPLPPKTEITAQYVIVGEGAGDAAFFRHLCAVHDIGGFQCLDAGGETKFFQYIKDLPSMTGFIRNCKLLLIVGDNDDDADLKFDNIRKALKKAKVPAPDNPFEVVKWSADELRVAVMMLPFDNNQKSVKGCLETILLASARDKNQAIANCVTPFEQCIGANRWANISHTDKFRLRALLAAAFKNDPNFGLQWAVDPKYDVIPLKHNVFEGIVDYLRTLPANVGRRVQPPR
jgi:hypothetical protein